MKLPFLAALAIVTCAGIEVHADEWPTTPQQAIDTSLERRIENALRDLEIFNARALKVDAQAKDGTLAWISHTIFPQLSSSARRSWRRETRCRGAKVARRPSQLGIEAADAEPNQRCFHSVDNPSEFTKQYPRCCFKRTAKRPRPKQARSTLPQRQRWCRIFGRM